MIIGYTVKVESEMEASRLKKEGDCQDIYNFDEEYATVELFEEFLMDHRRDEIVLVDISSVGLPMIHWYALDKLIKEQDITIRFLDKELSSNEDYLLFLKKIGKIEREIIVRRTHIGLAKAKARGIRGGRPSINEKTVKTIEKLYVRKRMSLREISNETGVSLGTVHKYIRLLQEND